VLSLRNLRHLSVLEHSNITLKIEGESDPKTSSKGLSPRDLARDFAQILSRRNAYHGIYSIGGSPPECVAVSGNIRSWIETLEHLETRDTLLHGFFGFHLGRSHPALFGSGGSLPAGARGLRVSVMGEEEQLEILRGDLASDLPVFMFKFVCDRGITHEVVRHRVLSFTQESTRYVNYRNAGMTFILPEELHEFYDFGKEEFTERNPLVEEWLRRGETIARWYLEDLARGLKPQLARDILPNLLKSDIIVSGRWSGWRHFIDLRDSPQAHPRIRELARGVRDYFASIGIQAGRSC
jgi:flavin-dependent thymidylate synthase